MTDRTTKVLLAAIAIGLFMNVFVPLLQPTVVNAQDLALMSLQGEVFNIGQEVSQIADVVGGSLGGIYGFTQAIQASAVEIEIISGGHCDNSKIC